MIRPVFSLTILSYALLHAGAAFAHASFVTSTGTAGKSMVATLNVPHGCEDANAKQYDSYKVEISIPAEFGGVRPMSAVFGKAGVLKDGNGNVTKLVWTKTDSDILADDSQLYQFTFRGTMPGTAFKSVAFTTVQYCRDGSGNELTQTWSGADAPTLRTVPGRTPGWNKYITPVALDLTGADKSFLSDAQIVWSGKSAWSINPLTLGLIQKKGLELKQVPANTEILVKY
ncbi:MAG: DUF1775 domain-containing protein [Fluviicoccus sp.]|uniref:DUF1775 domain-containing protein n=1 Tax=Fluviicoccus sp. TaxID=2003552 RepID=UPI0027167086|nr:DUF1775 domain-containing protein [Fluviicoccus sp.]MDO8328857.1 DUF1775 domain-containing protein [Fluviicoccus sp.]